jgi:hypothetical protein
MNLIPSQALARDESIWVTVPRRSYHGETFFQGAILTVDRISLYLVD